jgi:hypothetical protein
MVSADKLIPPEDELRRLAHGRKTIVGPLTWKTRPYKHSVEAFLIRPLCCEGVIEAGLDIRALALSNEPDRNLMFQVEFEPTPGVRFHLLRLEWRPLKPHTNKGIGPIEHRWRRLLDHHHPFDENAEIGLASFLPEKNLPIGVPLATEAQTFPEVLAILGSLFNIDNASEIPAPPWQYTLEISR